MKKVLVLSGLALLAGFYVYKIKEKNGKKYV